MAIKSDRWIRTMALEHEMIVPFTDRQVREGVISYGLSSYGYDMRVSNEFKVFTNVFNSLVDPKHFDERSFVDIKAEHIDIPPNSFALARTIEYFHIPRNVLAICLGKSTYARCGILLNTTPFEPGWRGYVTLEISNTTPLPARIYANEGIGQVLFFESDEECETSYADPRRANISTRLAWCCRGCDDDHGRLTTDNQQAQERRPLEYLAVVSRQKSVVVRPRSRYPWPPVVRASSPGW